MSTSRINNLFAMTIAVSLLGLADGASADLTKCKVKTDGSNGTLAISAIGVTGSLLWGDTPGGEINAFVAPCVTGDVAKGCKLGADGSLEAITPPAGCTIYLSDGSSSCSAYIKKCTPGVRDVSGIEARLGELESPSDPVAVNRIFASTTESDGAFGGIAGADAICAQSAKNAGLHGTWIAWISDATTNALDRLTPDSGPFITMDGFVIAATIADLTDGTLSKGIQLNQFSGTANTLVWTGTRPDGTASIYGNCANWTSTATSGGVGSTGATASSWTNSGSFPCNASAAFLCIEQ